MSEEGREGAMPQLKTPELGFDVLGDGPENMIGKCWLEGENVVWVDAGQKKYGAKVKGELMGTRQDDMTEMVRILRDAGYTWTELPREETPGAVAA